MTYRERPILFSAPMVRAIINSSKTQTRRTVKQKHLPDGLWGYDQSTGMQRVFKRGETAPIGCAPWWNLGGINGAEHHCPYGQPGDRLWVREAFSGPHCMEAAPGRASVPPSKWGESSSIWYWADGNHHAGDWTKPRPSIHMPRWASRITLEITGVRVERLNDISEAGAIAEGVERTITGDGWRRYCTDPEQEACGLTPCGSAVASFRSLWESINGAGSWDANPPWVWVIEFRRVP